MHIFGQSVRSEFVAKLAADLAHQWPRKSGETVEDQVSAMVERAIGYGLRDRGHIADWVAMELKYGTGFEKQPGKEAVRDILETNLGGATKLYKVRRRLEPEAEEVE